MKRILKMFVFLLVFTVFLPVARANENLAQKMSGNIIDFLFKIFNYRKYLDWNISRIKIIPV